MLRLHAELRVAFHKSLGWKIGKKCIWPEKFGTHTWTLWGGLTVPLVSCVLPILAYTSTRQWLLPTVALWMVGVFMPIGEWCTRREFKDEYGDYRIANQPFFWQRRLLHYALFKNFLQDHRIQPSKSQIKACLEFIESNRPTDTVSYSPFFKHPIVTIAIGVFISALGYNINSMLSKSSGVLLLVFVGVFFTLVMFLIIFSIRLMSRETERNFECFLRWYMLELSEEEEQDVSVSSLPLGVKKFPKNRVRRRID